MELTLTLAELLQKLAGKFEPNDPDGARKLKDLARLTPAISAAQDALHLSVAMEALGVILQSTAWEFPRQDPMTEPLEVYVGRVRDARNAYVESVRTAGQ